MKRTDPSVLLVGSTRMTYTYWGGGVLFNPPRTPLILRIFQSKVYRLEVPTYNYYLLNKSAVLVRTDGKTNVHCIS